MDAGWLSFATNLAFALFCGAFGNTISHGRLVLILWAKNAAGAILFAFCNYAYCYLDLYLIPSILQPVFLDMENIDRQ